MKPLLNPLKSHISVNTFLFHAKNASWDTLAENVHCSERLLWVLLDL